MTTFSLPRFRRLPGRQLLPAVLLAVLLAPAGSAAQAQVYYLDLASLPLALPERSIFVEAVIDGRPGQPPIGTVYQGLNNRTAAVLFRKGLEPALTVWLQTWLSRRPTDLPVVLCLRQLRISEEMSGLVEPARSCAPASLSKTTRPTSMCTARPADRRARSASGSTTVKWASSGLAST